MVTRKDQLQNSRQNGLVRKIMGLKSTLSVSFFNSVTKIYEFLEYETSFVIPISNAISQLVDKNRDNTKLKTWICYLKTQNKGLISDFPWGRLKNDK
jgi:hypothetical protein